MLERLVSKKKCKSSKAAATAATTMPTATADGDVRVGEDMVSINIIPPFAPDKQQKKKKKHKVRQRQLFRIASIGAGLQFGWAIQLSLLTPYVQELGIPHAFASYIWLCGPISGFIVQPIVGYYSDHCHSRFGPRRPFIVGGAIAVVISVILIGFSADLGHLLGDSLEARTKTRAIIFFVTGFWLLDLANNTLTGPCRALLADLAGRSQRRTRRGMAFFTLFLAIGNILGYAAGSYSNWPKIFPFASTTACNVACANLKSAFFLSMILLIVTTILSVTAAREPPLGELKDAMSQENESQKESTSRMDINGTINSFTDNSGNSNGGSGLRRMLSDVTERSKDVDVVARHNYSDSTVENGKLVAKSWNNLKEDVEHKQVSERFSPEARPAGAEEEEETQTKAFFCEMFSHMKTMPRQMWYIMLVTALTWIAWFPYLLYDTDWMGSDIYRGQPNSKDVTKNDLYNRGVRMGAFGLMLNSVVLGLVSLMVEPLCRKFGPSYLWGAMNVLLAVCFAGLVIITKVAHKGPVPPSPGVLCVVLLLFAVIGAPQAISWNVPYAMIAGFTRSIGGGQGLSMGVLNLAVVIPQVIISFTIGPFDQAFGGSNLPSFLLGSGAALVAGILAVLTLKNPPKKVYEPQQVELPVLGIRRTRSAPVFLKLA